MSSQVTSYGGQISITQRYDERQGAVGQRFSDSDVILTSGRVSLVYTHPNQIQSGETVVCFLSSSILSKTYLQCNSIYAADVHRSTEGVGMASTGHQLGRHSRRHDARPVQLGDDRNPRHVQLQHGLHQFEQCHHGHGRPDR